MRERFGARVACLDMRRSTDGSPIVAQPLALNDTILVQTVKGGVFAVSVTE